MRWRGGRRSSNIEDRRGVSAGRPMLGGRGMFGGGSTGGGGIPIGRGGGIGGILIAAVVLAVLYFSGQFDGGSGGGFAPDTFVPGQSAADDEHADFVSAVLADTEDTWNALFAATQSDYVEPRLVLFTDAVNSACGFADAAVGPFYCPSDQRVYIDLGFFRDLSQKFGAPGDFAEAYVIAHEIGHHVQNLLGISSEVRAAQRGLGEAEANGLSVQLELQADCFAGIWAHHADAARQIIEDGDVDEALAAASAIGDDRLQHRAQGYVVPESFTHGTSDQRATWFKRGLSTGKVTDCDTFSARSL